MSCQHNHVNGDESNQRYSGPAVTAVIGAFDRARHIRYFSQCLRQLPQQYESLDTNRLTLVHFSVHALDLMGVWDDNDDDTDDARISQGSLLRQELQLDERLIIEWIYSLQLDGGFIGGTFLGPPTNGEPSAFPSFNHGHIAMTYTALATLSTLGDDLKRINRSGILATLRKLQRVDGSFQCTVDDGENDLRFLYCACAISHMLNDWSGMNTDRAVQYICDCRNPWDGSFALVSGGQEGHGGSTFCAVASLTLMGRLDHVLDQPQRSWRNDLIRWCVHRQVQGMQGRPNKEQDTCYSFWIGASLRLLGRDDLLDHRALRSFVMKCQTKVGGFSKFIGAPPDLLHSFYSMAYLSWSQAHFAEDADPWQLRLKSLCCTLGICSDRAVMFGDKVLI